MASRMGKKNKKLFLTAKTGFLIFFYPKPIPTDLRFKQELSTPLFSATKMKLLSFIYLLLVHAIFQWSFAQLPIDLKGHQLNPYIGNLAKTVFLVPLLQKRCLCSETSLLLSKTKLGSKNMGFGANTVILCRNPVFASVLPASIFGRQKQGFCLPKTEFLFFLPIGLAIDGARVGVAYSLCLLVECPRSTG